MKLSIIVAHTSERVIGKNNALPWHLPEDLKRFKKITMGHPIVMGRKTYESIGRPLTGRQNIVLTRNAEFRVPGVQTAKNLSDALSIANKGDEAFVIGGSALFEEALPKADCLYLTLIHRDFDGDVYFPPYDLEQDFKVVKRTVHEGKIPHTFVHAIRKP